MAVMVCVPTGVVLVVMVVTPELLRVPVPITVEPRTNFTVPEGVPTPELAVTVAFKVMGVP